MYIYTYKPIHFFKNPAIGSLLHKKNTMRWEREYMRIYYKLDSHIYLKFMG